MLTFSSVGVWCGECWLELLPVRRCEVREDRPPSLYRTASLDPRLSHISHSVRGIGKEGDTLQISYATN